MLNKTKAAGYDLKKIYPVGFGVGAHVAGRIGSILKGQNNLLPRITGLDPAGLSNKLNLFLKIIFYPFLRCYLRFCYTCC